MPGPVGVQVFGGYAYRPGVFSSIDASALVPNRPGPGGTVGFVGMADGGVPGVVYNFRRYSDAVAVIRGGPALSHLARIFAPGPNPDQMPGASLVRFVRIGAPTQSVLVAAGLAFTARDYGRHTQGISVAIAGNAGTAAAAATGTLTSNATAPSDGDTVTIDVKTYTFKTALTATEGQVLIGATAAIARS